MSGVVILVEDDTALREATVQTLELADLAVLSFSRAEPALAELGRGMAGAVVTDVRMPGLDGFGMLARARDIDPDVPVLLVTGHGDVPMAVAALKQGAFDFLTKPFAADHLVAATRRALERRALMLENRRLRAAAAESETENPLIGVSPQVARLRRSIDRLAAVDVDVLIEGETGTGKDLVALLLHRRSRRSARPYVVIDCAALPADLAEAELFGHMSDSVPHSRASKVGRIAAVAGGTLLLDGIDALSPALQSRLLRVIEEREVVPIGATRPDTVSLRVVATSTAKLEEAVRTGAFRADLYHRIARIRLKLPALRERPEDVPLLFAHFLADAAATLRLAAPVPDEAQRRYLFAHGWSGNVRELRNHAFELVLGERDGGGATHSIARPLRDRVSTFEAQAIIEALTTARGRVTIVCELLGVPRKTLYEKMDRHGIDPSLYRVPASDVPDDS
ncbi:sigma-54-dependent transcriptional regulator [Sphingomonas rubra]|uniref:Two component, sigma54 specific, transcriptional regulator, Fis family n=1 Tax=Sphingomonas rubra TaxID=634430 RepID=A0A1I5UWP3_9SPHN|nr:sigma-54 dependent transcriptional regulator [Sphingomonas rubra]SFP99457.1 two component, sigma54 specific, transcriptional regulator, Fis family [Sphingomonas rubra]